MKGMNQEALHLLARATDLIAKCTDYEATLECIADLLVSSLASWCVIDLVTDDGKIERVAVKHRNPAKVELTQRMFQNHPAKPTATRGVYKVIATGKSILIPEMTEADWARRADSDEHLRMIMELGSTSYMCVPLKARNRVVGSIMLFSNERTFQAQELETTEQLARCIAMAVDNVHMFRKMQSTQEQLIHSAKLAALGVISAGIAHEVNNPLTIIKGLLKNFEISLAKKDNPALEDFKTVYEKANRSIGRIVKIVQHVKDFSRQSDAKFESLELQNLIESSLTLFEQQFYLCDITVIKNFPAEPLMVLGDFNRLEQVLVNIFANAKDAIKAKTDGCGGHIGIHLDSVNGKCRISITDNGIGFNSTLKERVFEPFFTTKDVGLGTGLGLSISHGIIKEHRGHITIHSIENMGAEVLIELPDHGVPAT
jgi:C4-dicarboxylate-specific signal transduction histidine kinase